MKIVSVSLSPAGWLDKALSSQNSENPIPPTKTYLIVHGMHGRPLKSLKKVLAKQNTLHITKGIF